MFTSEFQLWLPLDNKWLTLFFDFLLIREFLEHMNTTFNENGTMSYIPVRRVKFIPEKSVGDPVTDIIVIPNIPLLVSNYLVMIRINLDFVGNHCTRSI
jgi:hypothetical protein